MCRRSIKLTWSFVSQLPTFYASAGHRSCSGSDIGLRFDPTSAFQIVDQAPLPDICDFRSLCIDILLVRVPV